MPQGFVRHDRAEIRSADADVDDGANGFAGVPFPVTAAHSLGKVGHLVQHGVHVRHDVLAVDSDLLIPRRAQRHVQHRAVFGDVDLIPAEHRVDALAQAALLGEIEQQFERLVGDAVLGVVQVQAGRFNRQTLAALGVLGEQRPEMNVAHDFIVRRQGLPCRALGDRCDVSHEYQLLLRKCPNLLGSRG